MTETPIRYVVSIGRQFGCGGREIGKLIAQHLGIAYYDHELLIEAAKSSGMNSALFESADERAPKFPTNIWSALGMGYNTGAFYVGETPLSTDNLYHALSEVIIDISKRESSVIVGRTADFILQNRCKVISVFIHADIDDRIERIIARGDCDNAEDARSLAEKKNKLRAAYYNYYTEKQWGDAASYDLTINATQLGIERTTKLIVDYVTQRLSYTADL